MTHFPDGRAELTTYARTELRGEAILRGYKPRAAAVAALSELLPSAHVVVVSSAGCADCRREVPKLARIVRDLPAGWSVELRGDDERTAGKYGVQAIPTFILLDGPGGRELGRIIESPTGGEGIEGDLLGFARAAGAIAQAV